MKIRQPEAKKIIPRMASIPESLLLTFAQDTKPEAKGRRKEGVYA
jgi:hypothetical protein